MAGSPSVGCVEQAYSNSPSTFNRLSWRVLRWVESGGIPPGVSAASQRDLLICRPHLGPRCGAQLVRLSTRGAAPACKRNSQVGRSSVWRCLTGRDAIAPVAAHRAQADRSGSREHSHEAISPPYSRLNLTQNTSGSASLPNPRTAPQSPHAFARNARVLQNRAGIRCRIATLSSLHSLWPTADTSI